MIDMPRKRPNPNVEPTPHFDGKREGVINDPLATAGKQMGLKVDPNAEFGEEKTTFNFTPKIDPEMKRFEQLMKGTEKE